jgi:hypothetical protein
MGWMSWEVFRCETNCTAAPHGCINADLFTQMADELATGGYLAAGYATVSVDDCWVDWDPNGRNVSTGELQPDPSRFPLGMKALGDYIHSLGALFGMYTDEGKRTCQGFQVRVLVTPPRVVRVRVKIMGSQKCRNVGKSQSVLIMTDPIIFHPHP